MSARGELHTMRLPVRITTRCTLVNGEREVWSAEATLFGRHLDRIGEQAQCRTEKAAVRELKRRLREDAELAR